MLDDADFQPAIIRLPAFPGFPIPAGVGEDNRLWLGVKATCLGLRIDFDWQLEKLKASSDYSPYLEQARLPTGRGKRPVTVLEWTVFGSWITSIEEERVSDKSAREYIRLFKRQAWKAANTLLLHDPAEIAAAAGVELLPASARSIEAPARGSGTHSLIRELEDRVTHLEDVVALTADDAPLTQSPQMEVRHVHCPLCGGPLRIEHGQMRILADDDD